MKKFVTRPLGRKVLNWETEVSTGGPGCEILDFKWPSQARTERPESWSIKFVNNGSDRGVYNIYVYYDEGPHDYIYVCGQTCWRGSYVLCTDPDNPIILDPGDDYEFKSTVMFLKKGNYRGRVVVEWEEYEEW